MFRIVRNGTLRTLRNRAEAERIKRVAADHTCTYALYLLEEWLSLGDVPSGGYNGTLEERTRALTQPTVRRTTGVPDPKALEEELHERAERYGAKA